LWYCPICKKVLIDPDDDVEHEDYHITYKMLCDECGSELTYCPRCDAYHHSESFDAEHRGMKRPKRCERSGAQG